MNRKPLIKTGRPVELIPRKFRKTLLQQNFRHRKSGRIEEYIFFDPGQQWSSLIFALTPDNRVIATKQFRPAINKTIIELPGGTLEDDSQPDTVARVELEDETGYSAKQITQLTPRPIYVEPANTSVHYYIYLARDCFYTGMQNLSPSEEIEVVLIPVRHWMNKISKGQILDGKSIVATFLALPHLKK